MNKNALMNYALWARKELENQISLSLNRLGFYKTGNKKANIVGDYTIIEGTEETFPKAVYSLRNTILERHILENGFDETVEEFAYTWFNRIIALRFMEVHDYFNHGFRVLTSRDGSYEPEILQNVDYVIDDLKLDAHVVQTLKEQGKEEDLYRYILFSQCNSLSDVLPMLFDTQEEYMELLLPSNLLSQDSVIRHITDIPEEDFENDVEVIGWLYQFYNSVKKDEVNASKKPITKDTLPAVTQLFTPDWIVRYMAQNSVGRIWLESHPNSPLRQEMKYYVEDAPHDPETQKKLDEIKYKNLKLEDLTIIEPCCGSGHILVYVFDLLFEMYKEEGYLAKDIPAKILSRNLFGLDVDRRAAQLSQFALVMKARSIDSRFFNKERYVCPHVYELQDSKVLSRFDLDKDMRDFGFSPKVKEVTKYLVETFQEGKTIGSLLKVKPDHYLDVADELVKINADYIANIIQQDFQRNGIPRIIELCQLANILSSKFDVMITNPPYLEMGIMENGAKEYANNFYPNSKSDMFAMFMETGFVKKNGFASMINMQSWMFLGTFEELRRTVLKNCSIVTLLHLGKRAFDTINGDVVQTVSFVFRNSVIRKMRGVYLRLVNFTSEQEKELAFFQENNRYLSSQDDFLKIPGAPIAYWATRKIFALFDFPTLSEKYKTITGSSTGDNGRFLRLWFEVNLSNIGMNIDSSYTGRGFKWIKCNKGGPFRRWYGNIVYVINWDNNGKELKEFCTIKNHGKHWSRFLKSLDCFYKEGITWSKISSGTFSCRYMPEGCIMESAACAIMPEHDEILYLLGLMNSSIAQTIIKIKNPTLNTQTGDVGAIPVINCSNKDKINLLVEENIQLSKLEWDSFETSMDFEQSPLINGSSLLSDAYLVYKENNNSRFLKVLNNEKNINSIFKTIYHLDNEQIVEENTKNTSIHFISDNADSTDISNNQSCLTRKDVIESFISYAVGCIFGRYSLAKRGIAYAGGTWDFSRYGKFQPVKDNVLLFDRSFISDDVLDQFKKFLISVFGQNNINENLKFISESLSDMDSSPSEIISNYFVNDFYRDHLKFYQKRPIYWMLSSGKNKAFQCLFYLHRYNPSMLALINTKYFLPCTARYKAERERLETQLAVHELDQRAKRNLEKRLDEVKACQQELFEYGQVLDHLANQYIELDLDDGVKVNYEKFQHVSVEMDGRTVTKDLLVPIK